MKTKKRARRAVKAEEEKLAQDLGGRRTFMSGAGDEKGDARAAHTYQVENGVVWEQERWAFAVESKTTSSRNGYRLNVRDWETQESVALGRGEEPVFAIRHPAHLRGFRRWAVITLSFASSLGVPYSCSDVIEGRRTFKINDDVWAAHAKAHHTHQGNVSSVPYLRFQLRSSTKVHDLVLMEWRWFTWLTKHEEDD